jgi:hypothetical protein
MNGRSISVHAALLLAFLALAWFREEDKRKSSPSKDVEGEVVLEGKVTALRYERDGKLLEVEVQEDGRGRWFRGRSRVPKLPPKPKEEPKSPPADLTHADGDSPAPGAEPPAAKPEPSGEPTPPAEPGFDEKLFRASAEAFWKRLEPLRALRVVGAIDEARAKEYGLTEATGKLVLTVGGHPVEMVLGGKAFGTSDTYARLPDGRAVVLPGDLASKLVFERGPLFETKLVETPRPEIKQLSLAMGGRELAIVQHSAKDRGQTFWAQAGSDTGNDEYLAWVNKLFRLVAQEYREGPPGAGFEERLGITVAGSDGKQEKLVLFEGKDADLKPEYRIVSEPARLTAIVPRQVAQELVNDLAPLLP